MRETPVSQLPTPSWVTPNKNEELTGDSPGASQQRINDNVYIEGIHWRKNPYNRIQYNWRNIQDINTWGTSDRKTKKQKSN